MSDTRVELQLNGQTVDHFESPTAASHDDLQGDSRADDTQNGEPHAGDSNTGHRHAEGGCYQSNPETNSHDDKGKGKNPLYLPTCSGNHPKQTISNSMMQAYVSMRGQAMETLDDPLFDWIRERDDTAPLDSPIDHEKRISRMLKMIDEVLDSANPAGHTPRDSVFEILRPIIEHIEVPQGIDVEIYQKVKEKADKKFEVDSDDEEAGIPSGRISPCTFLAWSKDCQRWNYLPDDISVRCNRPSSPRESINVEDHSPLLEFGVRVEQEDKLTGEHISPCYRVPTNPSIIYTPPGIDGDKLPRSAGFMNMYSRMDPIAARELRDHLYGKRFDYSQAVDEEEEDHFTFSEVQEAARTAPGVPPGASSEAAGEMMTGVLAGMWRAIAAADAMEASLRRAQQQQAQKAGALELELRALRGVLVPRLRHRRAVRAAYEREARARQRRARIQQHMALYVRDVQHEVDLAHLRVDRAQRAARGAAEKVEALEEQIAETLLSVGKDHIQQVYEEVYDFDVMNSALDSGFGGPGVGAGAGAGVGVGVGVSVSGGDSASDGRVAVQGQGHLPPFDVGGEGGEFARVEDRVLTAAAAAAEVVASPRSAVSPDTAKSSAWVFERAAKAVIPRSDGKAKLKMPTRNEEYMDMLKHGHRVPLPSDMKERVSMKSEKDKTPIIGEKKQEMSMNGEMEDKAPVDVETKEKKLSHPERKDEGPVRQSPKDKEYPHQSPQAEVSSVHHSHKGGEPAHQSPEGKESTNPSPEGKSKANEYSPRSFKVQETLQRLVKRRVSSYRSAKFGESSRHGSEGEPLLREAEKKAGRGPYQEGEIEESNVFPVVPFLPGKHQSWAPDL